MTCLGNTRGPAQQPQHHRHPGPHRCHHHRSSPKPPPPIPREENRRKTNGTSRDVKKKRQAAKLIADGHCPKAHLVAAGHSPKAVSKILDARRSLILKAQPVKTSMGLLDLRANKGAYTGYTGKTATARELDALEDPKKRWSPRALREEGFRIIDWDGV